MENELNKLSVLIPAYKPGEALLELSKDLLGCGFSQVLVVNDGSGEDFDKIFSSLKQMGCRVIEHAVNMGKGRALKTGINDILVNNGGIKGVITADADGQHLPKDIINVGRELLKTEKTIVLGKRAFSGKVPLKSRFGNTITRNVFNYVSGQRIHDTQTGLRGLPHSSLKDMLTLRGERYEYEMNMLLEASKFDIKLKEVDIETVYINDNSGSHFNPVKDSWLIYKYIIMFGASSLVSFFVDAIMFALITLIFPASKATDIVWIPSLGARVISSTVNFLINRNVIFSKGKKGNLRRHIIGYYTLAAFILIGNIAIISLFKSLGVDVYLAYIISLVLFLISYPIQKKFIFK